MLSEEFINAPFSYHLDFCKNLYSAINFSTSSKVNNNHNKYTNFYYVLFVYL